LVLHRDANIINLLSSYTSPAMFGVFWT
jgi:hypothetical protein